MARLTNWLANDHPPWAAIRALMACRLMALDKQPGTQPVGIGEIFRRLMAKCVVAEVGHQATLACGNDQLCAGLAASIEGAVHAMRTQWKATQEENPQFPPAQDDTEESLNDIPPPSHPGRTPTGITA